MNSFFEHKTKVSGVGRKHFSGGLFHVLMRGITHTKPLDSWICALSFRGRWYLTLTASVSHELRPVGEDYNPTKSIPDDVITEPSISNSTILSGPGVSGYLGTMGSY